MPSSLQGTWVYPNGSPAANAKLTIRLVSDATVVGRAQIAPKVYTVTLDSSGSIPASAPQIFQSSELSPATKYALSVVAPGGGQIWSSRGPVSLNLNPLGTSHTNLALWSEQFDNAVWVKDGGSSVAANNATDPFGGSTADTWTQGAGPFNRAINLMQTIALNPLNQVLTFSVWLRVASGTNTVQLDISDLAVQTFGANVTVTTTWQRYSFTSGGFHSNPNTGFGITTSLSNAAGTQIQVWGAQLQTGSLSDYIQTTSASASAFSAPLNLNTLVPNS